MIRVPMSFSAGLLTPWEFSPAALAACLLAAALYARGAHRARRAGRRISRWRGAAFATGLALTYIVLQTHYDYVAQHVFWVHRLQHVVLHHLAPFLIMLAVPHELMAYALPARTRDAALRPIWGGAAVRGVYRFLQQPVIAALLFAGLVGFWLTPGIHFVAMLSAPLYKLMNWSMLVDGLLFWWLVVDPRPAHGGASVGHPTRIAMLWAVMLPQIALGAYIALSGRELYDVYSVCGRAWPMAPLTDQRIGGLITWIPSAMMSVVGILVVLRLWTRAGASTHGARAVREDPGAGQASCAR